MAAIDVLDDPANAEFPEPDCVRIHCLDPQGRGSMRPRQDSTIFGVKPQLAGQQASTGEIYAPYGEDIVRMARSFL